MATTLHVSKYEDFGGSFLNYLAHSQTHTRKTDLYIQKFARDQTV